MKVEFLRDENNNIWFSQASNIHIKRIVKSQVSIPCLDEFMSHHKRVLMLEQKKYDCITPPLSPKGDQSKTAEGVM